MKKFKPTTQGRRGQTVVSYKERLTATSPLKALTKGLKRAVGRNSAGRITVRHRGSGHKRLQRDIDFVYSKQNISATIEHIEYDPNRSAFIARTLYADGARRYHVVPQKMQVGDTLIASEDAPIKIGNRTMLGRIPIGTFVFNVEIQPKGGAKFVRSAGNYAEVIAHDAGYTHIKMPSSEVRKVLSSAWASMGQVSNSEHRLTVIGKAGRNRWRGKRPTVRGSAMNAVDHPHGGGEGRAGRGHRRARSKWGKPTGKGQRTRRSKKYSDRLIIKRRKVGKRR